MPAIRVLSNAARCMQRLGYLKRLVRRAVMLNTSSLDNLGNDLTRTVTRKERVLLTTERVSYIRQRLFDRVYNGLKKQADSWREGEEISTAMELQDLYLADATLPSQTGKLVANDWRRYPPLGLALGLIRGGTYSPTTRALSLLHLTPETELQAFLEYRPDTNPLRLSRAQALLLLYALLEDDGEVIIPLFTQLAVQDVVDFNDRDAGDLLPSIYRAIVKRHRGRILSADERDRLEGLIRIADSIEKWRGQSYSGGGAREHSSRPRVEPYTDIGLLSKPDTFHYSYTFTLVGKVWAQNMIGVETDEQIGEFLTTRFFHTAARAWEHSSTPLVNPEAIIPLSLIHI